jgi:hypothetical protein
VCISKRKRHFYIAVKYFRIMNKYKTCLLSAGSFFYIFGSSRQFHSINIVAQHVKTMHIETFALPKIMCVWNKRLEDGWQERVIWNNGTTCKYMTTVLITVHFKLLLIKPIYRNPYQKQKKTDLFLIWNCIIIHQVKIISNKQQSQFEKINEHKLFV